MKKKPADNASKPRKERSPAYILKMLFILAVGGTAVALLALGAIYLHFSKELPRIMSVSDYRPLTVTKVIATGEKPTDETQIGEFFKERRYVIPFEKIPEKLVQAFVAAEDDKFFEHPGINVSSIIRASIANFKAGHVVQGGSTITQQVVKTFLLTSEKSFIRKIKEVILASKLEHNLSKQQILYLYLNQIYLGHGAYGVQAAARTYYRKDVSSLNIAECALLAGLPQAPGKYSPLLDPKKAKERQLYVLKRMVENKFITPAQMSEAASLPLKIFHDEDLNTKYAAYLVEHVRRHILAKYGEKAVYEDGLTVLVPTTTDLILSARKNLRSGLKAIDKRNGYRGPVEQLKGTAEIEKFLKDERLDLVDRKLHHQILAPEGRLDPVAALTQAGIRSDADLLEKGESYKAVVTSIDDKKKSAGVMIGAVRAELPLEKMRWARPAKDSPQSGRGEPNLPSKILTKGDVLLVSVESLDDGVTVGLDQDPQVQGAIFSMEAETGRVLAMEGGYDYEQSEFNRATQAMRQPGSSFKPIIYAAGLEKGFTPASIIVDSPIVYEEGENGKWKPSNFEEKFYGDTTYRQALIHSRNIPTIKILQEIQIPYLIDYAKRLGIMSQFPMDLSISLGSAVASLVDMTKVYALFPRLGRKVNPIFWTKILDRDGRILEENKLQPLPPVKIPTVSGEAAPAPQASGAPITAASGRIRPALPAYPLPDDPDQVLDPRVAYVMTHLMKEVVNYGTGHEAKNLGRPAAGKTGTTNESIDAWFMGFTPSVVTGVWVGNDNQKPIGHAETGARAALPIWLGFMQDAVKPYPAVDFPIPPGVVFASIDANTGKLAPPNSSRAIQEAFIEGTQPKETGDSSSTPPATQTEFFKEDLE